MRPQIVVGAGASGVGIGLMLTETFGLEKDRVLLLERGPTTGARADRDQPYGSVSRDRYLPQLEHVGCINLVVKVCNTHVLKRFWGIFSLQA